MASIVDTAPQGIHKVHLGCCAYRVLAVVFVCLIFGRGVISHDKRCYYGCPDAGSYYLSDSLKHTYKTEAKGGWASQTKATESKISGEKQMSPGTKQPAEETCTDSCWGMNRPATYGTCACLNGTLSSSECEGEGKEQDCSCHKGD